MSLVFFLVSTTNRGFAGTNGLGRESILAFAKHAPAHVYFTGRDAGAAASLIDEIKPHGVSATFLELDMTSLSTVKAAVARFNHSRLDILMCNAGIMAHPPALTKDGYELQFGVNHLAHGAVIQGLLPVLQKTAAEPGSDVRIVCLTSLGWHQHPKSGILFDQLRTPMDSFFGSWTRYGCVWFFLEEKIFPSLPLSLSPPNTSSTITDTTP